MGRRTDAGELKNRVRELRRVVGLSQEELARQVGITRQAVSAIESGHYVPNTIIALHLARALSCAVEELFRTDDPPRRLRASAARIGEMDNSSLGDVLRRVHLARVGNRVVASPIAGDGSFHAADGVVCETGDDDGELIVELLTQQDLTDRTALVLGCDPSLSTLTEHIHRASSEHRVIWHNCGSTDALRALRNGDAHVAGTHLWDPESGESNLPAIRRELAGLPVTVIGLSEWQLGLIVQCGNPKDIRGASDLARQDVSIVNRDAGSGSRVILDYHLARAGLEPNHVRGYDRLRGTHTAVAAAIRDGVADSGPGILSVARAYGLDFIPLQSERYDLVIPNQFLTHPVVRALLDTATGRLYRSELELLGGYDSSLAGTTIAELTA